MRSNTCEQPTHNALAVNGDQLVELMAEFTKLSARLHQVETELKELKSQKSQTVTTGVNVATVQEDVQIQEPLQTTDIQQSDHNEDAVDEVIATDNELIHNSNVGTMSGRVKSAKTQKRDQVSQIYIGGVSGDTSTDDITADLVTIGIDIGTIQVRALSQKDNWKSFVVTVTKVKEHAIYKNTTWPKDIIVRPFLEQQGNAKQPFREQQSNAKQPFREQQSNAKQPFREQQSNAKRPFREQKGNSERPPHEQRKSTKNTRPNTRQLKSRATRDHSRPARYPDNRPTSWNNSHNTRYQRQDHRDRQCKPYRYTQSREREGHQESFQDTYDTDVYAERRGYSSYPYHERDSWGWSYDEDFPPIEHQGYRKY